MMSNMPTERGRQQPLFYQTTGKRRATIGRRFLKACDPHLSLSLSLLDIDPSMATRSFRRQLTAASLLSFSLLTALASPVPPAVFRPEETEAEYRAFDEALAAANEDISMPDQPFQLCLTCRCCAAGDPTACLSMSCCFAIDCGLPNKPYGVCAFAPKSCNCTSCS